MNSFKIVPAILPNSFTELVNKLTAVSRVAKSVQIDVMDGTITNNKTWPYKHERDNNWDDIQNERVGFPFWETFDFEVHLMVKDPEKIIPLWRNAGIRGIVIHAETENIEELAQKYYSENFERESPLYTELGIAVNLNTPIEIVYPLVEMSDFIQLMGIEEIGAQGRPFDERVYEKIKDLKAKFPHCIISIDGGVSEENAQKLIDCGADKLVIGSAVFGNQNPAEAYKRLKSAIVSKSR